MAAACPRHRLHGDDRQPAIWLDAVRPSDRQTDIRLGPRGDPGRVHDLRRRPRPGWCRSRAGSSTGSGRGRSCCCGGMLIGAAWMMNASPTRLTLLYVGAAIGGIGAGVVYGDLRRQRAEMVPRPARPRRRPDRGGLRRRLGADRRADLRHDHDSGYQRPSSVSASGRASSSAVRAVPAAPPGRTQVPRRRGDPPCSRRGATITPGCRCCARRCSG